jgi:hypothetical protein
MDSELFVQILFDCLRKANYREHAKSGLLALRVLSPGMGVSDLNFEKSHQVVVLLDHLFQEVTWS